MILRCIVRNFTLNHTYTHTHIYIYVCVCVCVRVYIYVYLFIYCNCNTFYVHNLLSFFFCVTSGFYAIQLIL